MHLRFVDRRVSASSAANELTRETYDSMTTLPDGMPLLLDESWRPVEPWLTYFRMVANSTSRSTVRNYGYDAHRFAAFLDARGTDAVHATADDIAAYRDSRLAGSEHPISPTTWQRNVVVIRGVYQLLVQLGTIPREPWISIGRSSVLGHAWRSEPDIRPLTRAQWETFRDVGLSGRMANGELDPSWRGRAPLRARTGAELAVTTGMRVSEFSTLLDAELSTADATGASVLLETCAKYQKRRRVSVPVTTMRTIDLYRQTERRAIVQQSAASLWARRESLLIVDEVDTVNGVIRARFGGKRTRWRMHLLPPDLRRIAVIEGDHGLEALGLFLGRGGLPLGLRSWHAQFVAASRRVLKYAPDSLGGRRARITPHDLRHTFAVVMLKGLMDIALAREADRQAGALGPASLSEHIAINPRLTVQRLLGHADPATTMTYLHYIEDTDALVQSVFESWSDETVTFAQAVLTHRSGT